MSVYTLYDISSDVNWEEIKRIDTIGIDEISLKKGHK